MAEQYWEKLEPVGMVAKIIDESVKMAVMKAII